LFPGPAVFELHGGECTREVAVSWSGAERRAHPRVAFQAEAELLDEGRFLGKFEVRDISVGGALLIGSRPVARGSVVGIRLLASMGTITLNAKVVRTQTHPEGLACGLQFLPAPSLIAQMIEEVVLAELERAKRGTSAAE
jgi:PilZ domain